MTKLTNLKALAIGNNKLEYFPEFIGKLCKLEDLRMFGNMVIVDLRGYLLKLNYLKNYG